MTQSNMDKEGLSQVMKQIMKDIQKDFHDPHFWEQDDVEVTAPYSTLGRSLNRERNVPAVRVDGLSRTFNIDIQIFSAASDY